MDTPKVARARHEHRIDPDWPRPLLPDGGQGDLGAVIAVDVLSAAAAGPAECPAGAHAVDYRVVDAPVCCLVRLAASSPSARLLAACARVRAELEQSERTAPQVALVPTGGRAQVAMTRLVPLAHLPEPEPCPELRERLAEALADALLDEEVRP